MSTVRTDLGITYEISAGTTKTFEIIFEDSNGVIINMSDTDVYNSGRVKIYKPDGTVIGTLTLSFSDRVNGKTDFTVTSTEATNANAGNWYGDVEVDNVDTQTVEQRQFNFNILESY